MPDHAPHATPGAPLAARARVLTPANTVFLAA